MENKVYIARTDVLNDEKVFTRLYNAVSEERRRKADRFVQKRDKMLSIGAEILLKRALSDCGIADFSLKYGENGKPYLAGRSLFFNLSHSENTVICAVSEREIGVDAEKVGKGEISVRQNVSPQKFFFKEYALGDGFKYAACGLCGEFEDEVRFVEL